MDINPNWVALFVASLSTLVVGFIWYNPKVFGTIWMNEIGMTEEKAKKANMPLVFGLSVVLAFLISFTLMMMVMTGGGPGDMQHGIEQNMTFKHGAFHGALLGIFVLLPVIVINGLYEQRSFKYMMVVAGYWIVSFAIMGGIINMWP